jgi:hypothetical protein
MGGLSRGETRSPFFVRKNGERGKRITLYISYKYVIAWGTVEMYRLVTLRDKSEKVIR